MIIAVFLLRRDFLLPELLARRTFLLLRRTFLLLRRSVSPYLDLRELLHVVALPQAVALGGRALVSVLDPDELPYNDVV
jgi:hypothetical protein